MKTEKEMIVEAEERGFKLRRLEFFHYDSENDMLKILINGDNEGMNQRTIYSNGQWVGMTIEQYREGLRKIDETAKKAKGELAFNYASMNNPHRNGDIVRDHSVAIKIERADVRIGSGPNGEGIPMCVYYGPTVDVDGNSIKGGRSVEVWQSNIIESIEK